MTRWDVEAHESAYVPTADIPIAWANVRFGGQCGHRNLRASRPLLTQSGRCFRIGYTAFIRQA